MSRRLTCAQLANRLTAVMLVDQLCADVVDHPDTWRERAIDEIARALDNVDRRVPAEATI